MADLTVFIVILPSESLIETGMMQVQVNLKSRAALVKNDMSLEGRYRQPAVIKKLENRSLPRQRPQRR